LTAKKAGFFSAKSGVFYGFFDSPRLLIINSLTVLFLVFFVIEQVAKLSSASKEKRNGFIREK